MDLVADQLTARLPEAAPGLSPVRVCPRFLRLAGRLPGVGRRPAAFNADRLLNRFVVYPRHARRIARYFDLFHVADHTYSQIVHALPAARTGVYCHDLDAFRCLLDPASEPRPGWFRRLATSILTGLRKAAVVFYSTDAVRDQLLRTRLVDPARLVHAPYGVAAEFVPVAAGPVDLPVRVDAPFLLNVGSPIPRKRLDVLLDVFEAVRERSPDVRLVQVGGPWPAPLAARIDRSGLGRAITQVRGLTRDQLAGLYRRAAAVLVPSETEGFGLPVIEALACGTVVVASDIPPLREVGGRAVVYRPVADVPAWVDAVSAVLTDPSSAPDRETRLARASLYSWSAHARVIGETYLRLPGRAADNPEDR